MVITAIFIEKSMGIAVLFFWKHLIYEKPGVFLAIISRKK